ncbi:AraC family transcriptional regulator [Muriicola sp. Z0-33]|uniref:AraC family transcriptional regulator n=1 Tax=Muriicola sp. Z0-33 TaxID=2816957 RepID=UPI002238A3DC|nr:helix-turn-helix domain-containing protein [Muriicola sp. Z0-33]MCW5518139.1 helix-turn-helix domain-containing protein [Muriicola sp. Z0-33]
MSRILIDISILLNILGFGQGLFLSITLWRTKKRRPENIYLIYLLIGISIIILNSVFRFSNYINELGGFEEISNSFLLIIAPSAFIFTQFKTGRAHQHSKQLIHFVPLFIYLGFNLIYLASTNLSQSIKDTVDLIFYLIFNIQFIIYFGLSLYRIGTIKPLPNTIKWLRIAIWLIMIPWIIQLCFLIFEQAFGGNLSDLFKLNLALLFGVCAFFLSYVHTSAGTGFSKGEKYEGSKISAEELKRNLNLIKKTITTENLYLDKDISLIKISNITPLTPRDISQSINLGLKESFVDFINNYRVDAFKLAIKKESSKNYTMIGIAENCGFKSSSAFYAAFKKSTGITPKQYKDGVNSSL